ncbi:MAG: hypothetical protein M1833_005414 [Piccolia ochrophora]|nr:MAG: hypothetical protein M1833_005414 [Piccolia ochrophora]
MRLFDLLCPALLAALSLSSDADAAKKPANSVLLSNVKSLTLRKGLKTSHRRVSAIPQLKCVGGDARKHYDIDVMRCKNQGADYDDENIQWTCTASLPPEFKLGSTEVICEGYDSPDDPYILKGSCGVEYRLMLTDKGEEKYGGEDNLWKDFRPRGYINWSAVFFWAIFIGILGLILYSAFVNRARGGVRRPGGNNPFGWGGGGGGGGGDDDPPPPYDHRPPRKQQYSSRQAGGDPRVQQGWRPGFLTGALGGAAAGYFAGNRGGNNQQPQQQGRGGLWGNDGGAGSSRWGSRDSGRSESSSSASASRYESTGFGSTSRR